MSGLTSFFPSISAQFFQAVWDFFPIQQSSDSLRIKRKYPHRKEKHDFFFFFFVCRNVGSQWALEQAKYNLVNEYMLVGVTEELEDFVMMLEAALPRFFKGATELYKTGAAPATQFKGKNLYIYNNLLLQSFHCNFRAKYCVFTCCGCSLAL